MVDITRTPVSQIMSTDVLTLHANATLADGISTLGDYGVSGAPVLDEGGRCIGVFSLADIARRDAEVEEGAAPRAASYFNFGVTEKLSLPAEDYDPELFERETVGDWMSAEMKSVTPDTPVWKAARILADEGIHRLLVVEENTIRGIVTSLDIADLVADAGEMASPSKKRAAPKPRGRASAKPSTRRRKSA